MQEEFAQWEWTDDESVEVGYEEVFSWLTGLVSRYASLQVRTPDEREILSEVVGVVDHVEWDRDGDVRGGRSIEVASGCGVYEYPDPKEQDPRDWRSFSLMPSVVEPPEDRQWIVTVPERDFRRGELWLGPGGGVTMSMDGYSLEAWPYERRTG